MSESKYVAINVVISLIIAFIVLIIVKNSAPYNVILQKPLEISYEANIKILDNLTLTETYTFQCNKHNKYRMLYRYWQEPVFFKTSIDKSKPQIIVQDITYTGQNYYVKDHYGHIFFYKREPESEMLVKRKAIHNEIGLVNPNYFKPGTYVLNYTALLIPSVQVDSQYARLMLKFADKHMPYKHVRINIEDPEERISQLSTHFNAKVEKTSQGYVVTTSSWKNELLELDFLLTKQPLSIPRQSTDLYKHFKSLSKKSSVLPIATKVSNTLFFIFLPIVLLYPLLLIWFYQKYGSEKQYTVPEYINFVVQKRKPWIVNMLFHKNADRTDLNAFIATLLDLYNRKIIDIQPYTVKKFLTTTEGVRITILREDPNLDDYESMVLSFIKDNSVNGVFDTERVIKHANNRYKLRTLTNYHDSSILNQFIDSKPLKFFSKLLLISLALLILIFIVSKFSFKPMSEVFKRFTTPLIAIFVNSLITRLFMPIQVFSRWKNDHYKEKLMWDSFARFLKSLAKINKQQVQDIAIWKEWLIYGTALGVGEQVVKAMKNLNIAMNEVWLYPVLHNSMRGLYMSASSSGHGSGFGSGFGGGGAGGR